MNYSRKIVHPTLVMRMLNFAHNASPLDFFKPFAAYWKYAPYFLNANNGIRSSSSLNSSEKGFAQAYTKQEEMKDELKIVSRAKQRTKLETKSSASFATLLRKSAFVGLGEISGKTVVGKVVEVQGDYLFIDYGGKFLCPCRKPRSKDQTNFRNATVHLKLLDWELSARFLGATTDVTLLESEGVVVKVLPEEGYAIDGEALHRR